MRRLSYQSGLVLAFLVALGLPQQGRAQVPPMPSPRPAAPDDLMADHARGMILHPDTVRKYAFVRPGWLPVRTEADAVSLWGMEAIRALASGALLADADLFTANLEVASDVAWVLRAGLGLTVSRASEEDTSAAAKDSANTQTETLSRLLQEGGTVYATVAFPLWWGQLPRDAADKFRAAAMLLLRGSFGWDSPSLDSLLRDPGISGTVVADLTGLGTSHTGSLGFEAGLQARVSWFNNSFKTRLQTEGNWGVFLFGRVGIALLKQTRLGINFPLYRNDDFKERNVTTAYLQQIFMF